MKEATFFIGRNFLQRGEIEKSSPRLGSYAIDLRDMAVARLSTRQPAFGLEVIKLRTGDVITVVLLWIRKLYADKNDKAETLL